MQCIVIKQSSARPTSSKPDIVRVTNPARGGEQSKKSGVNKTIFKRAAYSGNQMASVLSKATYKEELNFAAAGRPEHRKSEQLKTMGKCTLVTTVKAESDRDARWADVLPDAVPFTVTGILQAVVEGNCEPLYSEEGKHRARPTLHPLEGLEI